MIVRRISDALKAPLDLLQQAASVPAVAAALLPLLVVLMFPAGFGENESQYFMLSLRKILPAAFSEYSAAFDTSDIRILSDLFIGGPVYLFGYETAQIVLRCAMMLLYAGSLAFLLTGLGLSALEALLVLAIHAMVGPDLMGAEWLFLGVEAKTFAYACLFLGFGFAFRERPVLAALAMALGTWFHFLVGGFWFLALVLLMLLQKAPLRSLTKMTAVYAALVLPLVALVVQDQLFAHAAPLPAHGLTSDYLYAIIRVPHHATPFASTYELGFWLHGIIATLGLFCAVLLLAPRLEPGLQQMMLWIAALLGYLLLAVGLSWFDRGSGILGKFLPFRPSALILLFSVVLLLLAYRSLTDGARSGLRVALMQAAFVVIVPVCLWTGAKDSIKLLTLGRGYNDLPRLLAYLHTSAGSEDIVLTDPNSDMQPLGADLPRLIPQPTLVSFKYVPQNPADIYRWWDLLEYRKKIYAGACPGPDDPPVRFLLYIDRDDPQLPSCGHVVFRSPHFTLAELRDATTSERGQPGAEPAPAPPPAR